MASFGQIWPSRGGVFFNTSPRGIKTKLPIMEVLQGQAFKMEVLSFEDRGEILRWPVR